MSLKPLTMTIKLVRPKSISPRPVSTNFAEYVSVKNEMRGEERSEPPLPSLSAQIAKLVFVFSLLPFRG